MITFTHLGNYGRLGNQLFQIASTIGIAIKNNEEYSFPKYPYNKYFKNPIPEGNLIFKHTIHEPHFHYYDFKIKECNLHGYFQSEDYFSNCIDIVKTHFSLKEELEKHLKDKYTDILSKPNCSLHVRRGDYLQKQDYHPVQPFSYYEKSIEIIGKDKIYLVFSDDIKWCKETFKGDNFFYIEEEDILELFLMSYCDNNIIANSSFSWWGAWLNNNINKKVIAPINWFGHSAQLDTKNLIPKTWLKI